MTPLQPVTLRIRGQKVDGNHILQFSNDGIVTTANSHGTKAIRLNHQEWPSRVQGHHNAGASRLLPSSIDFSTTDIIHEWRGQWGAMRFSIAPDQFTLEMWHGPVGACDFDLTLTFESQGFTLANRFDGLWDVKFYNWKEEDRDTPEGILQAAGWEKLVAADPVAVKAMDRFDFRVQQSPFWQRPSPLPEEVTTHFCALVAESTWTLPAGVYEARTFGDDGVRVWIDDQLTIDDWPRRGPFVNKSRLALAAGAHRLRVHWYQEKGSSGLQFSLRLVDALDATARIIGAELIANGGCEEPLVDGKIPGWQEAKGSWKQEGETVKEGKYSFDPPAAAEGELRQDFSVAEFARSIDAGEIQLLLTGFVRSHDANWDASRVVMELRNERLQVLHSFDSGEIRSVGVWQPLGGLVSAPPGTRSVRIRLISTRRGGKSNDAWHDALSLRAIQTGK
jgi:hypothetical protein